jgi:hypothetical protein
MALVQNDSRDLLGEARRRYHEAERRLPRRKDAIDRAAETASKMVRRSAWPGLFAVAALGFVAGAVALGARKVAMRAVAGVVDDWFAARSARHAEPVTRAPEAGRHGEGA